MIRAAILLLLLATTAHAAPSADELRLCDLINARRADAGVARLRVSSELYAAAKAHSDDLAAHGGNCDLHNSCNGETWSKRVGRYYPGWIALGENVATSTPDPEQIVTGWMSSGGHRANILSTSFTEVGCAITMGQTGFGMLAFATADFGSRGLLPQPSATPRATASPTAGPVGIERVTLRSTRASTTLSARVLLPPGAPLAAPVALEIDGMLVAAIPADCIALHGRGARSTCVGADVRIAPSGAPRYRIRLRFAGVHAPTTSVRLSAAGQTWDVAP